MRVFTPIEGILYISPSIQLAVSRSTPGRAIKSFILDGTTPPLGSSTIIKAVAFIFLDF